ncbi:hypothetical protein [Rhizobium leguminosarum]
MDEEWRQWSDREIARRCRVSHPLVTKMRSEMTVALTGNISSEEPPRTFINRYGDTAVMNTGGINAGREAARLEPPPPPERSPPMPGRLTTRPLKITRSGFGREPIKRSGELLKEFDGQGQRTDLQPSGGAPTKLTRREAAEAAGMSKDQQTTAIRVANVPAEDFERQQAATGSRDSYPRLS